MSYSSTLTLPTRPLPPSAAGNVGTIAGNANGDGAVSRLPTKTDLCVMRALKEVLAETPNLTEEQRDKILQECQESIQDQYVALDEDAAGGRGSNRIEERETSEGKGDGSMVSEPGRVEGRIEAYNVVENVVQLIVKKSKLNPGRGKADVHMGKDELLHCYLFPTVPKQ